MLDKCLMPRLAYLKKNNENHNVLAILKNNNIWISKNTAATFGAFLEKIGVLLFHRHQDALLASKKNV